MRLDIYLAKKSLAPSRSAAQALIKEGKVKVAGTVADKPSLEIDEDHPCEIEITENLRYVSRGALKLERALDYFKIDVRDLVCVDVGASTGGFTDLLLQRGAKKVFALDVGSDQLAQKLREDKRVVSIERFNARELSPEVLGEICDIAVMDVSFISQKLLFAPVLSVLREGGTFIALIKPQFECGDDRKKYLSKGGIVKSPQAHEAIISSVIEEARKCGFYCEDLITSPIKGGDGNIEYLALYRKNKVSHLSPGKIKEVVSASHKQTPI